MDYTHASGMTQAWGGTSAYSQQHARSQLLAGIKSYRLTQSFVSEPDDPHKLFSMCNQLHMVMCLMSDYISCV